MPSCLDREATKKMYNSLTVSLAPLPLLGLQFSVFRRRSRRETLSLAPSRPQQRRRRAVEQGPDEVRRVTANGGDVKRRTLVLGGPRSTERHASERVVCARAPDGEHASDGDHRAAVRRDGGPGRL